MKIDLKEITVRDLVEGYHDDGEGGVRGYDGKLDIRPKYQREFIYKDKQREAVIRTIRSKFPLNVMYWAVRDDGTHEVIDGQQRTISVCQYVHGDFSFDGLYFHNLPQDQRDRILDYELMVYACSGADSEKLEWFKTINIAGEKLTNQELRNAVYSGPWISDAKRYFSRRGCVAQQIGHLYMGGSPIRQDYLETAIKWISDGQIEDYMGRHQHNASAEPLWTYFTSVMEWVGGTFTKARPQMKGVAWGPLYHRFKDVALDPDTLESEIKRLMLDDDVTKKSGVYPYLLTRDKRHLNIRAFSQSMKRKAYERQDGICSLCSELFDLSGMEADHIRPWSDGGKTTENNCQVLCRDCNRRKLAT